MSDLVERIGNKILDRIMSRLSRMEPGSKYVRVSRAMAIIAAVVFILDLHKYGSWYMGNSTYWHPWAYIVMPCLVLPGIISVMAYYVRQGHARIIRAIIAGILVGLCIVLAGLENLMNKHFPDPGYFGGWIRSDGEFWFAMGFAFLYMGGLVGITVYSSSPKK